MVAAREVTLQELLGGSYQYTVPLYQRTYSWGRPQWQRLWEDVVDVADHRRGNPSATHFIGSLVLAGFRDNGPGGVQRWLVVDGQQRLTTLTLLLAAVRDHRAEHEGPMHADRVNEKYLVNKWEDGDLRYKVLPTQADRGAYRGRIEHAPDAAEGSRISEAHQFFRTKLLGLSQPSADGEEEPLTLAEVESAVVAGLSIVSVTTGENDNAHRIFESLNNTGLKLTQGDLLRNYLFMQLPTRADEVYTTLWLPLQNLLSNEELETLFWLDLVQQDPKVRQTEIYAGQQRRMRGLQDESQVRAEVERFLALGRLYDVMLRPEKEKDDAVRFRLARLRAWRTTTTFPITLHLMERRSLGDIDSDELARALLYLESYLVRRLVFGRYSDGLNTTLLAATADIQGQDDPADALQRFLSSGRKHFASDDQIRQAVMTAPFYTTGRAAHRKLILRWIEESYGSKEPVDLDSATIEHVMPQTLTEEWERALADQLEAHQDLREVHTELLHTLGNLTLTGYNSELSNGPFAVKRAELAKSGIRMNQEISAEPVWGPAQIRARAERLADRIVGIWPGPSAEAASGVAHTAWQTLTDAVEAIPAGSWTSYGELARLIGSHPVPVGTYLARTALPHAHRVLQAGGTVSPSFRWTDVQRTDDPHDVLAAEGVRFSEDGRADGGQRLVAEQLAELIDVDVDLTDPRSLAAPGNDPALRDRWVDRLHDHNDPESARALIEVQRGWVERGGRAEFADNAAGGCFLVVPRTSARAIWPVILYPTYGVEVVFYHLAKWAPFTDEALLDEFRGRLNLIPGVEFGPESLRRRPSIKPQTLQPAAAQEAFLDALEWFLRTVQEDDRTS